MKIELHEFEGCFSIEISAETIDEAAKVTRMGMNARKNPSYFQSSVYKDGQFHAAVVFPKNRRGGSDVPRRK